MIRLYKAEAIETRLAISITLPVRSRPPDTRLAEAGHSRSTSPCPEAAAYIQNIPVASRMRADTVTLDPLVANSV